MVTWFFTVSKWASLKRGLEIVLKQLGRQKRGTFMGHLWTRGWDWDGCKCHKCQIVSHSCFQLTLSHQMWKEAQYYLDILSYKQYVDNFEPVENIVSEVQWWPDWLACWWLGPAVWRGPGRFILAYLFVSAGQYLPYTSVGSTTMSSLIGTTALDIFEGHWLLIEGALLWPLLCAEESYWDRLPS